MISKKLYRQAELKKIVKTIDIIKSDIIANDIIDWNKYCTLVKLIQENNRYFWVVEHLDNDLLKYLQNKKDETTSISLGWWQEIFKKSN